MPHSPCKSFFTVFLSGCLLFSLVTIVHAQEGTAELGVFETVQVAPGSVVQLPVSVRNVQDLYGVDFTLDFDPTKVQVEDADPLTPGIQAALGEFLDPGLLLFNIADNEKGTLRFTMSQYNPSEPKSGSGILLVISFVGKAEGESVLNITNITLSTRDGVEIPSQGVNSTLLVSPGASTQVATYPVAEVTGMIIINTYTPTPLPTKGPTATPTPTVIKAIAQESPTDTIVPESNAKTMENSSGTGYFLVNNWWIVLILLVVVIGAGFYMFKNRNSRKKEKRSL